MKCGKKACCNRRNKNLNELTCFKSSASVKNGDHCNSMERLDIKCSLPCNISSVPVDVLNS